MSDETDHRTSADRGDRAQALLDDELLNEVWAALEAEYIEGWKGSKLTAVDARERVFLAVQILGGVRRHLQQIANDGKLAKGELARLMGKEPSIIRRFGANRSPLY